MLPSSRRAERDGFLASELSRADPGQDGWSTEVFYDTIKPRLNAAVRVFRGMPGAGEKAEDFVSPEITTTALRPAVQPDSYQDSVIAVWRGSVPAGTASGHEAFRKAVADWLSPYAAEPAPSLYFKIFQVTQEGDAGTSRLFADSWGTGRDGNRLAQNALWDCGWEKKNGQWRLVSVKLAEYEECRLRRPGLMFSDCTVSALGALPDWDSYWNRGMQHWRLRLEARLGMDSGGTVGLCVADVDGDGLEDLFSCDLGALPKKLLRRRPDGVMEDITAGSGLDLLDKIRCAQLVDLDNDGDRDAALATDDHLIVFSNDGKGRFTRKASVPIHPEGQCVSAADFDLDGDLDLYVCGYGNTLESFGDGVVPTPIWDANNGAPNFFYRNDLNCRPDKPAPADADWRFTDITALSGMAQNNSRFSYAASWADFDRDGDPDLHVANDYGRDNLYRNDLLADGTRKFQDVAPAAGVDDVSPGMSTSWGDLNEDGYPDLYVANMFSGAGSRITSQLKFKTGVPEDVIAHYRRQARGNTLFLSNGDGTFKDASLESATNMGRWAWGSPWWDVNNDGRLDLAVANGYLTGEVPDDL